MALSVASVLKQRDRIVAGLYGYPGSILEGSTLDSLIADICSAIKFQPSSSTMLETVKPLLGQELSDESIRKLAWRIAGNIDRLKANKPVLLWLPKPEIEWAPIQFVSGKRIWREATAKRKAEVAYIFVMRILSGSAAAETIKKIWSSRFCYIASRHLGFTRTSGDYPFSDPMEFVSLRCTIAIDPVHCKDGEIGFEKIGGRDSLIKWNRKIMSLRQREGFKCPENYDLPCYLCWHGYNYCPAACRRIDLVRKPCAGCSTGWFDPDYPDDKFCIDCVTKSGVKCCN